MKFTHFQRKSVSLIVLATFVALLHCWAMPAQAATRGGNSETTLASGDSGGPGFIEEESSSEPVIKKGKKFPWLFVGLGLVAVGVAVYFLVIKKTNYTLTVTLGAGCSGTPAENGTYEKGKVVNYSYTALPGYGNLQVKVDGAAVATSGTITMDKNKALVVTADALDIRGTWAFTATGLTATSFSIQFTGTATSGTLRLIGYTNTGTYTVNGANVTFDIGGGITFTGKFNTSTTMSGNHTYGTWSATRTSTTAPSAAPAASMETLSRK